MKKGVGLALSGGAVRGVAHIGVLEVLEEEGIPVTAIAGTSAGSLVGALYAAGVPLPEIRKIAIETAWKKIFMPTLPKTGLISSDRIGSFLRELLPVRTFASTEIPFAAVAADLRTGEKVVLRKGAIARAVQASCAIPLIFTPTTIRGRILVDGGVASQIPVRTVREELGVEKVAAVDVNYRTRGEASYSSIFDIAAQVSMIYAFRNAREEKDLADAIMDVDASGIAIYDVRKTEELLARGRKAARKTIGAIRELAGL
jgi:NTE family protein